jgi:hypothetical protein
MITPKQVYDAYPDSDLLPFDPPEEGETCSDFRHRVGSEALASDTLFQFILFEVANDKDPVDLPTAVRRLQTAIGDLQAVIAGISGQADTDNRLALNAASNTDGPHRATD